MSDKLIKVLNAAFFYIIWWGCILGIKYSYNYLGPLLAIIAGIVHLNIIPEARKESKVILSCGILALFVESLHLHSGFLSYEGYVLSGSLLPPLWILCIWMTLGATLNYSMFFLKDRWLLMVLCGGVFGPGCYFFAMKGGILHFNFSTLISLLILSIIWGISLPLMYHINKKIYRS